MLFVRKKKLLITGCGRSGTLYAVKIWQSLGLKITHERPVPPNGFMGKDGIASWYMVADDYFPPSGPSSKWYKFDVVIHQVRFPLDVIASVAQFIMQKKKLFRFISRNLPQIILSAKELQLPRKEQLILQASRYWYYWNLLAEKKSDYRIKLENYETDLPKICAILNVDYNKENIDSIPKNTNERKRYVKNEEPWKVTWEEIKILDLELLKNICNMAKRYGYEIPENIY